MGSKNMHNVVFVWVYVLFSSLPSNSPRLHFLFHLYPVFRACLVSLPDSLTLLFLVHFYILFVQFEQNRQVTDPVKQQELLAGAQKDLQLLKRQSVVNQMFSPGNYYMDSLPAHH